MESFLGKITPQNILNTKDEDLRNNSVSRQKVVYLKELSKVIVSKDLKLDTLSAKTDEQIKSELTAIKGIGNWTAEVYIMFCIQKDKKPRNKV